jgi:L-ascorbate metabolism protein UlaG (beta-lactamase superfamily)
MKLGGTLAAALLVLSAPGVCAQVQFREDVISTSSGELTISFVGHGTLMFAHGGKVIHVDPVMRETDYSKMPQADLILVTHRHGDHLDAEAIGHVRGEGVPLIVSSDCRDRIESATVMMNGAEQVIAGLEIAAVPAYNIVHKRDNGSPYHPKGDGNGYVITFGDVRVYVAGDTENVPEMQALREIDVAFLPMNLPYTMTPEMVAEAAKAFRPRILYPYHYGRTDTAELVRLLEADADIEVRVRQME